MRACAAHVRDLAFLLVVRVLERLVAVCRRRCRAGLGVDSTRYGLPGQVPTVVIAWGRGQGRATIVVVLLALDLGVIVAAKARVMVALTPSPLYTRTTPAFCRRIWEVEERSRGLRRRWVHNRLALFGRQSSVQPAFGQRADGPVGVHGRRGVGRGAQRRGCGTVPLVACVMHKRRQHCCEDVNEAQLCHGLEPKWVAQRRRRRCRRCTRITGGCPQRRPARTSSCSCHDCRKPSNSSQLAILQCLVQFPKGCPKPQLIRRACLLLLAPRKNLPMSDGGALLPSPHPLALLLRLFYSRRLPAKNGKCNAPYYTVKCASAAFELRRRSVGVR